MEDRLQEIIEEMERKADFQSRLGSSFFWFTLFGLGFMASHTLFEILYGTGYSHPIWNDSFNWLPLIAQVVTLSFISSLVYANASTSVLTTSALKRKLSFDFVKPKFDFNPAFKFRSPIKAGQWLRHAALTVENSVQTVFRFLTRSTQSDTY